LERRLAAILAADVADYSRLMGEDEAGTLAALRLLRHEILASAVEQHRGNLIKSMGDGWLVEFPSAGDAVGCAIGIQEILAGHEIIKLRIGLHIGDVTFEDDDIYGDGVNIASRLQELSAPGGIVVSENARRSIDGKLATDFQNLGQVSLKNIAESITAYAWSAIAKSNYKTSNKDDDKREHSDRPSIAVLPFNSLSSDPDQEFFADGIVEDLITALSRFPWLLVIARNSCFSYKDKNVSIKQVAQELDVRYVVEGSVRSSSTRLRVTAQLIDAESDTHIWADNYDRPTGDLFDLQDEMVQSITGVLVPALNSAERERALQSNRPSLGGWEAYQRGLAHYYRPYSDENHSAARQFFDQAIESDPKFADAYAMIALMGVYAVISGQSSYSLSQQEVLVEAKQAAENAVQSDDNNALAHTALGRIYQMQGVKDYAIAECEMAVKLNPNLALAHHELGFVLNHALRFDEAVRCHDTAIRLSPNDPSRWNFHLLKSLAQFGEGKFNDAVDSAHEASRLRPMAFWPFIFEAGSLVALGHLDKARIAVSEAIARKPDCNMSLLKSVSHGTGSHYTELIENLGQAGLPE
jgi:adenylate cyclase